MSTLILALWLAAPAARAQNTPDPDWNVEMSSVVAQAKDSMRVIKAHRPSFYLRFPSLELFVVHTPMLFAVGPGVRLSSTEVQEARTVFGDALDYDAVRIEYVEPLLGTAKMTWGDAIRVPKNRKFTYADLIHELGHVWQYQTAGTGYISDSLLHQADSLAKTGDTEGAYDYKVTSGASIFSFAAEQQAQILEDYYKRPKCRADPDFQRMVAQVKATRPVKNRASVFDEQAAGLAPRGRALPPLTIGGEPPPFNGGPWVPQLELRFPGL